jgi:hypothetical protein
MAARSQAEPLEACRPQEVLKIKAPKYPELLGRAIRCAPHMEAFIPDVKSWVSRTGWHGYKSTPTSEVHACGHPTRLAGPYLYLGIARPRYLLHADLEEVVLVSR